MALDAERPRDAHPSAGSNTTQPLPDDTANRPTIGAIRRRRGISDADVQRRVLAQVADSMVQRRFRTLIAEECYRIGEHARAGGPNDVIAGKLRRLAFLLDGGVSQSVPGDFGYDDGGAPPPCGLLEVA
jgi:hypothetical protein